MLGGAAEERAERQAQAQGGGKKNSMLWQAAGAAARRGSFTPGLDQAGLASLGAGKEAKDGSGAAGDNNSRLTGAVNKLRRMSWSGPKDEAANRRPSRCADARSSDGLRAHDPLDGVQSHDGMGSGSGEPVQPGVVRRSSRSGASGTGGSPDPLAHAVISATMEAEMEEEEKALGKRGAARRSAAAKAEREANPMDATRTIARGMDLTKIDLSA